MDFEKTFFRIHQRVLQQESVSSALKVLKITLASLGVIFLALFLYANCVHRNTTGCLGSAYSDFREKQLGGKHLPNDTVIFINICSYNKTAQPSPMGYYDYTFFDTPILQSNMNISTTEDQSTHEESHKQTEIPLKNEVPETKKDELEPTLPSFINPKQKQLRSLCLEYPRIQMEHTAILQSLSYPREMRVIRNITTAVVYIEPSCYSSNYLFDRLIFGIIGIEPIIINEIIENFKHADIYLRNLITEESWAWSPSLISSYDTVSIGGWIERILISLLRINIGLFFASSVASLYIKINIICSPAFILLFMFCMRSLGNNEVSVASLGQAFPYIGIYLQALRGQPSRELVKAFLKLILLLYFIYLSSAVIVSFLLFTKNQPKGIEEKFMIFISLLELLVLIFIRTRSSIKWFPKVSILILSVFLFYVQNTSYGYFYLLLIISTLFILSYFCMILEEFEVPGVSWSETLHYTPSLVRPRCLYFPIFNLNWFQDLPQLWTMFYPLYGREHFTPAQLSLVDSNYTLFNQTMENAERIFLQNDLGMVDQVPQQIQLNQLVENNQDVPISNNQDLEMQDNQQITSPSDQQQIQSNFSGGEREAARDAEEGVLLTDDIKSHEQNLLQPSSQINQIYQGRGIQIGSNEILNRSDSGEYQKLN